MKCPRKLLALVLLQVAFLPGIAAAQVILKLHGDLVTSTNYSPQQFAQLPHTDIAYQRRIEAAGAPEVSKVSYRGVLLKDLLARAGMDDRQRRDFRRAVVIVRAADGYVAIFTWGELFNTDVGKHVLVVREIDGRPLPQSEGALALRSFSDHRPGPRHVRLMTEIEVRAF